MGNVYPIARLLDPGHLTGALGYAGLLILLGIVVSRILRRALKELISHDRTERLDQITLSFLSHLSILVLWVVLAITYTHLIPALNRLGTALLAGFGLISVIAGLAAQTTLGNLVSGISLVLYKPFRRGDRLQVPAPTKGNFDVGVVEDITLGFTVLRTDDGRQIIVANGTMAQQTMIKIAPDQAAERPQSPADATTAR
jgi:small-conductance mechanosensitive channel